MDVKNDNPNPVQPGGGHATVPTPKRDMTKDEVLLIELYKSRITGASKDTMIIKQQIQILDLQLQDAEKAIQNLKDEEGNFLESLRNSLGLSTLEGWTVSPDGKLSLKA